MQYYVMTCSGEFPSLPIAEEPELPDNSWWTGTRVEIDVPKPLLYILDGDEPGKPQALYDAEAFPVMRDDLVAALLSSGVDNLELYDAVLVNPMNKKEYTNYKAFNVVGLISAADMARSTVMDTEPLGKWDTDFESLAIDESKARGLKLFRLAENVSAIIVHESVKNEVERQKVPGMDFYEPQDWAG